MSFQSLYLTRLTSFQITRSISPLKGQGYFFLGLKRGHTAFQPKLKREFRPSLKGPFALFWKMGFESLNVWHYRYCKSDIVTPVTVNQRASSMIPVSNGFNDVATGCNFNDRPFKFLLK